MRRQATARRKRNAAAPRRGRFTRTQERLLREAAEHPRAVVVSTRAWGRGPLGGRVDEGKREGEAAVSLRDAGLLEFSHEHVSSRPEGGYTIQVRDTYWKATAAGLAAAASLGPAPRR